MWLALAKLGVPDETVYLIKSCHQDMKARIRIGGAVLEPIDVKNGLRQGCHMAPVLFNLHTCLAVERWLARVKDSEGVGITIKFQQDRKLLRRYTVIAREKKLTECQFANDAALLSSTSSGAETAVVEYQRIPAVTLVRLSAYLRPRPWCQED